MSTTTEPDAPSAAHGMRRVGRDEFFAYIGHMNVHPKPEGRYDQTTGYVSEWRMAHDRRLIAVTDGGTPFLDTRFWLVDAT